EPRRRTLAHKFLAETPVLPRFSPAFFCAMRAKWDTRGVAKCLFCGAFSRKCTGFSCPFCTFGGSASRAGALSECQGKFLGCHETDPLGVKSGRARICERFGRRGVGPFASI